jgi:hypothetical protein
MRGMSDRAWGYKLAACTREGCMFSSIADPLGNDNTEVLREILKVDTDSAIWENGFLTQLGRAMNSIQKSNFELAK